MSTRFLDKPDLLDTIAIGLQSIAWLFGIPLIIIHMVMLTTQYKVDETVRKLTSERELSIIICLNLLCIIQLCINLPLTLMVNVWFVIFPPLWVSGFIYSIFWIAILFLYAVKTWKLHYKQQLNIAVAAKLWQTKINANIENWYIQNQNKYANNYNLFKILFPIYILFIAISTTIEAIFVQDIHDKNAIVVHMINSLWICLPLIVSLIIFCKSNEINDQYGIRDEFNIQTIFLWIFLIVYTIEFILFNTEIVISIDNNHDIHWRIQYLLYSVNMVLINSILALTSTLCPLYMAHNHRKNTHKSSTKKHEFEPIYTKISNNSIEFETSTTSSSQNSISLLHIIADETGFRLFIQHLITEFSTETLLFMTEVIQCKYIYTHIANGYEPKALLNNTAYAVFNDTIYDRYDMDETSNGMITITLPHALTYSGILMDSFGEFTQLSMHEAMLKLYNKYILETSPFTINISGEMRKRLHAIFNDEDDGISLLHVFDEAVIDMLWTLQNMSVRFQATEVFQQYKRKKRARRRLIELNNHESLL